MSSAVAKQSCSSTRSRSDGSTPELSYAWLAASRVSVFTSGCTWSVSVHGSDVITDAEIFTARLRCSSERLWSFSSETSTRAALPSPVGQHISSVFGYAIISAPITSSSENCFWYCASGLSVEWAWFFSATLANCSKPTPSCSLAYSMPACANTPGMSVVPTRPSTLITEPYRPEGSYTFLSERGALPRRLALPIFSRPTAMPVSASPDLIAMYTQRMAVAPVAHALATL